MNLRKILVLVLTVFVIGIAFYIFSLFVVTASHPDDNNKYSTELISTGAKIYRNYYDIPHIVSQSENDMFFALGYSHASNRLWQMDYNRRIAEGRLSEIFGSRTVNTDKFMRLLGLHDVSQKSYELLDKQTKNALKHYSDGINFYLSENGDALPIECNVFDYVIEEWQPVDCVILFKLYAFRHSKSFFMDIILGTFTEIIGVENTLDLIPSSFDPPEVLSNGFYESRHKIKRSEEPTISDSLLQDTSFIKNLPILSDVFNTIGTNVPLTGTNVLACRSTSKPYRTFLSNDFHSSLSLPCDWYQVHLTTAENNVVGLTIPGIPFVFCGRNDNISWGMANMMLDDCDYFIHELSSKSNRKYISPSGEKDFVLRKDTIIVKDSVNIEFYKYYAGHDVVISKDVFDCDVKTDINYPHSKEVLDFAGKYYLTFDWVGFVPSAELSNLYNLMISKNWTDFKKSLSKWGSPALNFVMADNKGNIGLIPKGFVPIRNSKCNPNIPNPAWDKDYSWQRIEKNFPFGNLYNPEKNYVAAANNVLTNGFKTFISSYFESSSRAERIDNFFRFVSDYSLKDIKQLQFDLLSPYANRFRGIVIPVLLNSYHKFGYREREAFRVFRDWDCIMSPLSSEAAFYSKFLDNLAKNIFSTYLIKVNYDLLIRYTNISYVRLLEILESEEKSFGRYNENEIDSTIVKSFYEAITELEKIFKSENIEDWKYGSINKVEYDHFLSNVNYYDNIVKVGPFEVGGDFSTINYFQPLDNQAVFSNGTISRFVLCMNDNQVYSSIAGGVSGQPLSQHYSDQIQLLLNGGYVSIPISKSPTEDFKINVTFLPE